MAKLYKTEMYILDVNDMYDNDLEQIIDTIEMGHDFSLIPFNTEEVDIEWDDDIDLNKSDRSIDTFRRYFNTNKGGMIHEKRNKDNIN